MTRCATPYRHAVRLTLFAIILTVSSAQTTVPEWRRHTPLPVALTGHAVALLPNGDILVAGGLAPDGASTRSSLIYSAATGRFTPTINQLNIARAYHALIAVATSAGLRVFAIGGYGGTTGSYRAEASVEVLE